MSQLVGPADHRQAALLALALPTSRRLALLLGPATPVLLETLARLFERLVVLDPRPSAGQLETRSIQRITGSAAAPPLLGGAVDLIVDFERIGGLRERWAALRPLLRRGGLLLAIADNRPRGWNRSAELQREALGAGFQRVSLLTVVGPWEAPRWAGPSADLARVLTLTRRPGWRGVARRLLAAVVGSLALRQRADGFYVVAE